jgi:hypothetical protein
VRKRSPKGGVRLANSLERGQKKPTIERSRAAGIGGAPMGIRRHVVETSKCSGHFGRRISSGKATEHILIGVCRNLQVPAWRGSCHHVENL